MMALLEVVHGDPANYPEVCRCKECGRAWYEEMQGLARAAGDEPGEDLERVCADCGVEVERQGDRGRWPERCPAHAIDDIAAKQRAYREEHRDDIAAKQRAYREEHRDDIAAKKRAYYEEHRDDLLPPPPSCGECGRQFERRQGRGRYPRLCVDCKARAR